MKLKDLLREVDVIETTGSMEVEISAITFASGEVKPGSVFVAVPGLVHDGAKFIGDALSKGAAAIVSEAAPRGEAAFVRVLDAKSALDDDRGIVGPTCVQVLVGRLEEGQHRGVFVGGGIGALEGASRACRERAERPEQQKGFGSDRLHRIFPGSRLKDRLRRTLLAGASQVQGGLEQAVKRITEGRVRRARGMNAVEKNEAAEVRCAVARGRRAIGVERAPRRRGIAIGVAVEARVDGVAAVR